MAVGYTMSVGGMRATPGLEVVSGGESIRRGLVRVISGFKIRKGDRLYGTYGIRLQHGL